MPPYHKHMGRAGLYLEITMGEHRCIDCGTPLVAATGFGLMPTEVADGRPHTDGGCVEYIKAALSAANRSDAEGRAWGKGMAGLASHLQAELDQERRRADEAEASLLAVAKTVRAYIDSGDQDRVAEFDAMEAALDALPQRALLSVSKAPKGKAK